MDLDFLDLPKFDRTEQQLCLGPERPLAMPFEMAPVSNPERFTAELCDGKATKAPRLHFLHGTTTLGFKFAEGVVIAVDSRSTMGPVISSQTVKKVIEINSYLLGTMAGGAADCSFWERELGMRCRLHELRNKQRISVAAASKLLANTLYYYKRHGLSVGTMIAGWDKKGPGLFFVDNDGIRLKGDVFSVGSGSPWAYGVLDQGWRWDLTAAEAVELGRRAIYHAVHRDAYSGGFINVYLIQEGGWTKISRDDNYDLHYTKYGRRQEVDVEHDDVVIAK